MKSQLKTLVARTLSTTICGAVLVACGGGDSQDSMASSDDRSASTIYSGRSVGATSPTTSPTTTSPSTVTPPATTASAITNVRLENTSATVAQSNVPFTFGQVFTPGHLAKGASLVGRLSNGTTLPLQIDVKASHPDGSVRHAVISGVLPSLAAGTTATLDLVPGSAIASSTASSTTDLLNSGFTATANATIAGTRYSASAADLIKSGKFTTWLSGSTATEWHVSAPLKNASGASHPHLSARFAVRWYPAIKKARVDVTIENNWAYEPSPQNFTYDAEVVVGGKVVYSKPAMVHFHHARWRKLFWNDGATDRVNVKHNTAYLIDTKALPNFDRSLVVPETALAALKTKWTGTKTEPMGVGMALPYMPNTGGRDDIGLLPAWAAVYLLSMDNRAKQVTMGTADLAGSWSMHYRDKLTDRPISVMNYPYMTILGRTADAYNPVTKKSEAFPACPTTDACATPNKHDSSHQPAFAYFPYMVTGDYFYLEELQFWTMWNVFSSNPNYRQTSKGLLATDQVRGQAWSMRSLAEAAYITPDTDVLKSHFTTLMANNLTWYNTNYTDNASANVFHALTNGAMVYNSGTALAPWQDDFFTSAIGHAVDLGFTDAKRLLTYKAKFPVMRMTDPGICWIDGALYSMTVRTSSTSPFFTTMKQAADLSQSLTFRSLACGSAEQAAFLKLKVGEMTGFSSSAMGYPSNMQPALAYAVGVSGTSGQAAWSKFMSRSVKPDYRPAPQFAILPR